MSDYYFTNCWSKMVLFRVQQDVKLSFPFSDKDAFPYLPVKRSWVASNHRKHIVRSFTIMVSDCVSGKGIVLMEFWRFYCCQMLLSLN